MYQKKAKSSKTVRANSVWAVCASARKVYASQLEEGIEVRRKALNHCLDTTYQNYLSFDRDFEEVQNSLLDSQRFVAECKELGFVATNVAQNVIFDGKDVYTSVRDKGIKRSLKNASEYNEPLHNS